jgi:uncharacterized repeat protein (TIGR03803 family)
VAPKVPPCHEISYPAIDLLNSCGLFYCVESAPFAGLTANGTALYGTTETGGSSCCGTIFRISGDGVETGIYNFTGGTGQGFPAGTMIRDSVGNLYGTAQHGEVSGAGSVFKLTPDGHLHTLYQFKNGADGGYPLSSLVLDAEGNLYGTASSGGNLNCYFGAGCGVVFKIDPNGVETVLYAFDAIAQGQFPSSSLLRDGAGNLYGTTPTGGDTSCNALFGCGVIFKIAPSGQQQILHTFRGGTDGSFPETGLTPDGHGGAYGTTSEGGGNGCFGIGCGIIYHLGATGYRVVYSFLGSPSDGSYPVANLIMDSTGALYGTTEYGGNSSCDPFGCGTVFKLGDTGKETVIHAFNWMTEGGAPRGPLVRDRSGNLYGTTSNWGPTTCNQFGYGTIFKIAP